MFLSIIIPVYNSEKYVGECIESCINQNIDSSEYEIICVNDGSTDKSLDVLKTYEKAYSNITVIDKANEGISKTRNLGLDIAKGDYIWFVDSDDFIGPNILKRLMQITSVNKADRNKVDCYCFTESMREIDKEKLKNGVLKYNYPYRDSYVTRTIYKNEYLKLHNIRFKENLILGEDRYFNFESRIYKHKDKNTKILGYFYRKNSSSITAILDNEHINKRVNSNLATIDLLLPLYNKKVAAKKTKEYLRWCIQAIWVDFSEYPKDEFEKKYNWKTIKFKTLDFGLKIRNNISCRLNKTKNYDLLQKLADYAKWNENRDKRYIKMGKTLKGYVLHPKRLIRDIKKSLIH